MAELFRKLVAFSPVVGVFGHRQVGKTTYCGSLSGTYYTLDDRETRLNISRDPKAFVTSAAKLPLVLDECQIEPELFPAIKERVRTHKRPGQFVLTGSVRFTSRKAIRESLAGRMVALEMFPLILSELMNEPLPDVLPQLLGATIFSQSHLELLKKGNALTQTQKVLEKYLLNGGLPGLCFLRQERLREEGLFALHDLILDRDLRLVVETRLSFETLRSWLRLIAANTWEPYNAAAIKRAIGLSHQTQKSLLYALESIFLIRRLPIMGRAGEIILLEDQYEELLLSKGKLGRSSQILSAVFRNIRAQFLYRLGEKARFESYWTRSGARIPLVVRTDAGVLGISVIVGEKPTLSQRRAAESFLRHETQGKVMFVADQPLASEIIDPRILICPVASIL